jgi:hypothetical protein
MFCKCLNGKCRITLIAAIICMAFFLVLSGCIGWIGPAHWDGWVGREIVVTVFDENSTDSISGATVTLQHLHRINNSQKESKLNATTGPDGVAKLFAFFPGGGKKEFLTEDGAFSLVGTLEVAAEEYSTLTEPLSSLVGKKIIPIGNKSAIHVRVNLTKKE